MAEASLFQPHRFRTAASHYLAGRPAYAPRLIEHVRRFVGLSRADRVLDLGCGPGMLAGAFARLAGEVVAMDPEPEMGRSFQWMDRPATLRSLEALVEPDGAVALFSSGHRDAPDTGWTAAYQALVRRYAADDSSHPRCRADGTLRHEAILLASAFDLLDEITVIERREVTVQQLVERALSRSSTAPDRLGDAVPRLAAEIEALLVPLAKDGTLPEVIATTALIARRPEATHP